MLKLLHSIQNTLTVFSQIFKNKLHFKQSLKGLYLSLWDSKLVDATSAKEKIQKWR